jgi:uncharacterized protein YcbX
MTPTVSSIHIYPVKSTRANDLAEAAVEPWGLAGDRRWVVVDPTGAVVTQRDAATLALVTAAGDTAGLRITAPGRYPLAVARPGPAELVPANIFGTVVKTTAAGALADEWFSDFLARPVRLLYLDDPTRRELAAVRGVVSFADDFPILLTTTGSLGALNDWLLEDGEEPVPMRRFRPNLVVHGAGPWAEDGWRRIRIGQVVLRSGKSCSRCVMTTIDQDTAVKGHEPLRMLGRRRNIDQELRFGQAFVPDTTGTVRVGDPVEVLG